MNTQDNKTHKRIQNDDSPSEELRIVNSKDDNQWEFTEIKENDIYMDV